MQEVTQLKAAVKEATAAVKKAEAAGAAASESAQKAQAEKTAALQVCVHPRCADALTSLPL